MRSRLLTVLIATLGLTAVSCAGDPQKLKQQYLKSGDSYVAQKKYSEAIVEYRNAVAQDGMFGEARLKLGQSYEQTGDLNNAMREYVRAADLMPDNAEAQLRAGRLLNSFGRYPEAKARATTVLGKDPKNVGALLILGNALAGLKDIDAAVQQVQAAIDQDPSLSMGYAYLAQLQINQGNAAAARTTFQRAVEVSPTDPLVHLNLGNFLWATGDRPGAEKELKAALALDPKSTLVNRALAAFYIVTRQPALAESHLKTLIEQPNSTEYKLVLIDQYLAAKRTNEAIALLEPLSKEADGFVPAKLRLAAIDFTQGRHTQAYATIEDVLKQRPKDPDVLDTKTRFLIVESRFGEAAAAAALSTSANPTAVRSHFLHGLALQAVSSGEEAIKAFQRVLELAPASSAAQMQLATLYLDHRHDSKAAMELLGPLRKSQPTSGRIQFLVGEAKLLAGDVSGASAEIAPLAKANPSSPDVQALLARLYLAKDDRANARSTFNHVLALQPDSVMALNGLVTLDIVEKKPADARARIEAALAKNANNPPLLFLAGSSYATMGDFERAEPLLLKHVELVPDDMSAYARLVEIYLRQSRLDQAKARLEAASTRLEKPVGPATLIGMILETQGKPAEARKFYERALAIDSGAPVASNNLAWQYAEAGDNLDVGLKLAQTAKSKLPANAQVTDTLGWLYYKKGLTNIAIRTLLQATEQNPSAPGIQYHLGLAYLQNGQEQQARRSLERALNLNAPFKGAADAKQVLETIKTKG